MLQHAPAGPLRKLLIELLPHSEAKGRWKRASESERERESLVDFFTPSFLITYGGALTRRGKVLLASALPKGKRGPSALQKEEQRC